MSAERMAALEAVARKALDDWDRHTCTHEDTSRGGFLWTICDGCGAKWADDEGGFQPYSDPPGIAGLRAALDALPSPARQPAGETLPTVVQFQATEHGLQVLGSDGSLWWSGSKGWQKEPTPPGFLHSTVEPTP